jgi:hypothetical protein
MKNTMATEAAMRAWNADRKEACAILERYGYNLTKALPGMAAYWVTVSARHDTTTANQLALTLATAIHRLAHGVRDAVTGIECVFPLGADVAVAAALPDVLKELPGDVTVAADRYAAACAALTAVPPELHVTHVLPAVLGTELPLAASDAAEVLRLVLAGEDIAATKAAALLGQASVGAYDLRVGVVGAFSSVAVFRARMQTAVDKWPTLLYRALTTLRALGPGVWLASASAGPALPGFEPVVKQSLANKYAKHVEHEFEKP